MSKKYVFSITVVLVAVGAGFYFLRSKPEPVAQVKDAVAAAAPTMTPAPVKKGEAPPMIAAVQKVPLRPAECTKFIKDLQAIYPIDTAKLRVPYHLSTSEMTAFSTALKSKKLTNQCEKLRPDDPIGGANLRFWQTCGDLPKLKPGGKEHEVASGECLQALVSMRAMDIAEQYIDTPAKEIADPELLRVVMGGTVMLNRPNGYERFGEFADRLVELQPKSATALSIATQAAYLQIATKEDVESQPLSVGDPRLAKVSQYLERLEKSNPEDPRILETKMLMSRATGDYASLYRQAEEAKSSGQAEVGSFFSAMASYSEGKAEEAKQRLQDLIKAHPESARAVHALDVLQRVPAGEKAFTPSVFIDSTQIMMFDNDKPVAAAPAAH